jgi:hypothetical protein
MGYYTLLEQSLSELLNPLLLPPCAWWDAIKSHPPAGKPEIVLQKHGLSPPWVPQSSSSPPSERYSNSPGTSASPAPSSIMLSSTSADDGAACTPSGAWSPDGPAPPGVGTGAAFFTFSSRRLFGSDGVVSTKRMTPPVGYERSVYETMKSYKAADD